MKKNTVLQLLALGAFAFLVGAMLYMVVAG